MRSVIVALLLLPGAATAQSVVTGAGPLGLDRFMPSASQDPDEHDRVVLGRLLFFDPILSLDSSLSCASCHQPSRAFADGRTTSIGVRGRTGVRNVPAILNRGWGRAFFWDGRTTLLEDQVLKPISETTEMGFSAEGAVARLARHASWRARFRLALGAPVSRESLAGALAAYVRSIRAGDSRFDRAMLGDERALTAIEQHGLQLFQGRARCVRCHSGALLTDESFHNTGIAWREGAPRDSGRAIVSRRATDVGSFKTPTLREIGRTAPYMHDGSLRTLDEVIDFYDKGGHANPYRDPELQPLDLSPRERTALLAFLAALDGRVVEGPAQPATPPRTR